MSILVTGATGFIGNFLVKKLKENDVKTKIRALILPSEKNKVEEFRRVGIETVIGDLTDLKSLNEATKNIELIFHLAAEVNDNASLSRFNEININGTKNLVEAFVKNGGKKFIYISTAGIYGLNLPNYPISEDYKINPLKGYRSSKYKGELELMRASEKYNFHASIIRPPIAFGPHDNHFSPKLFKLILNKKTIPLFNRGNAILPLCYVEDVVDSLIAAAERENTHGEAFIVTSYHVTQKELFDEIGKICGLKPNYFHLNYLVGFILGTLNELIGKLIKKEPKLSRHIVKQLGRSRLFNTMKAEKILGVKTRYSFTEAWKKTYESYLKSIYLQS